MRLGQVLVYEPDGRIAGQLRELAEARKWWLREPRRPEECLGMLAGGPAVLVMRLSGDRDAELALLDRVTWLCPDAAVVVVADAESAGLVGLAWDLGAAYVVKDGRDRELLPEIVLGLMGGAAKGEGE